MFDFTQFRQFSLCAILIGLFTLVSCSQQTEELFDTPATQRVKNILDKCKKTLIDSPYGWTLEYKAPDGIVGNFILHFMEHDSVSMYADFTDAIAVSSYSFNYGQGPILSFDTYSALHSLADPEIQPLGDGHKGDFEFVIISIHPDYIVLSGRKNRDRVVLHKSAQGLTNKIRLEKQMDSANQQTISFFHILNVNGVKSDVMLSRDCTKLLFSTGTGSTHSSDIIYTTVGFDLASPFDLGGESVNHFIWDETTKKFKLNNNYAIVDNTIPAFSVGATANQIAGSLYDVVGNSKLIESWFSELKVRFSQYLRSEIYFNIPTQMVTITRKVNGQTITDTRQTTSVNKIAYSFLFNKPNAGVVWNNFNGESISFPREDRILVKQAVGTAFKDGENATNLTLSSPANNIPPFLFNSTGLTVYIDEPYVYLVSTKDSKKWIKLQKSIKVVSEQISYINF